MESKPYSSGRDAAIPDNLQLDLPHSARAKKSQLYFHFQSIKYIKI